jgi:hypothetical protein
MRLVALGAAFIMLAGCAAPPSDGGLWSRQLVQQELAISRLSNQQRDQAAHEFELRLADEDLASLEQAGRLCEGRATASGVVLDGVGIRVGHDPARQARVARLAFAVDLLRQGQCQQARAALDGALSAPVQTTATTIVTRSPAYPGNPVEGDPVTLLVEYALGWTDTVRVPAGMAQHLVSVYGGAILP